LTENIQRNLVGSIIEQQGLRYRDGGAEDRREYHAITRGWIANELFRRVDSRGRTIGQFLRDDLCGPLDADTYIGVPEQVLARIVPISPLGLRFHLKESLKPGFLGRRVKDNIFQTTGKLLPMVTRARRRTTADAPPPFEGMEEIAFFNERSVAMGETPSANTHSSARGLARLAAVMANRGRWQDVQYLEESAWQAMHDEPETRTMGFNVTFTQGGLARFGRSNAPAPAIVRAANDGREGFYGWMGLGGSIFRWHPELGIGFAFVPTSLHVLDIVNERGKLFQAEVLRCVQS
ncbi:MAG: serine hydrolase, partial [Proteobacteria bacterium]|nr:serine hydrolase [Pseudomonadota bacterium]